MPKTFDITDWPIPAGLTKKQHHAQVKKILTAARKWIAYHTDKATLCQVAAGIGLSIGEIRDDSQLWDDTAMIYKRLEEKLRGRLHDVALATDKASSVTRSAVDMMKLELQERQLSSDNQLVVQGTGFTVNVVNYARQGKRDDMRGDTNGDD